MAMTIVAMLAVVAAAAAEPVAPEYGSLSQHLKGTISLPYGALVEPFESWFLNK